MRSKYCWKSLDSKTGQDCQTEISEHRPTHLCSNTLKSRHGVVKQPIKEKVPTNRIDKSNYDENKGHPKTVLSALRTNRLNQVRIVALTKKGRVSEAKACECSKRQQTKGALGRNVVTKELTEMVRTIKSDRQHR